MKIFISTLLLFMTVSLYAQEIIPLYPAAIPNSLPYPMKEIRTEKDGKLYGLRKVSQPTLTVYLPDQKIATGAAVIICPGGGYSGESYMLEGSIISEAFIKKGIAAFILKYRLPSDSIMKDKSIGPLQDAQQAIKTVRARAKEWNIHPQDIGIMGFSAGGHLASTAGTHFDKSYIPNDENISLRPDFMILVYPVISMKDDIAHKGSRENLLGKNPTEEMIDLFSNDLHINSNTSPTWITQAGDDTVVPVENSIRIYRELVRNKINTEMHLYPKGNHGFVLKIPTDKWMQPLFDWMTQSGIIK